MVILLVSCVGSAALEVDRTATAATFDGIGAISGGGATSVPLPGETLKWGVVISFRAYIFYPLSAKSTK